MGWAHDPTGPLRPRGRGRAPVPQPARVGERQAVAAHDGYRAEPVFLSEYGVGSLFDAVTRWPKHRTTLCRRRLGRADGDPEPPDVAHTSGLWPSASFLTGTGSGWTECTAFPRTALADSELNQSRHRATTFDYPANGNIAGYNLTGHARSRSHR